MGYLVRAALCALVSLGSCVVGLAKPSEESHQIGFFEAIDAKTITVRVIPHDDTKVTLLVTNNTKRSLAVELPGPIAAIPRRALAQFGLDDQAAPQQSAQNLGIGLPGGGNPNLPGPFRGPAVQRNAAPFGRGLFNIPSERTLKRTLPAVCLQHGLPTPNPRMEYQIAPLKDASRDVSVRRVLEKLADQSCGQRTAQLASWHLASDVAWEALSDKRKTYSNGRTERLYEAHEIKQARKLVDWATHVGDSGNRALSSRTNFERN